MSAARARLATRASVVQGRRSTRSVAEVPGLYLANGFSDHGVMHSPATGRILSDLILRGRTELIDARALDLARFAEGRLIHETAVL